jgi:hypothetical protein
VVTCFLQQHDRPLIIAGVEEITSAFRVIMEASRLGESTIVGNVYPVATDAVPIRKKMVASLLY